MRCVGSSSDFPKRECNWMDASLTLFTCIHDCPIFTGKLNYSSFLLLPPNLEGQSASLSWGSI